MASDSERIEFPGSLGHPLAARLERPAGPTRAYALFAHCFTCSKDSLAATRIARALGERGVAVLRFDFTGLGGSGGDFANTTFSSNVRDIVHAADFLREKHAAPTILIGHSLGGAAVLAAAREIDEVRAVVSLAAPFDPSHVRAALGTEEEARVEREGEATVSIAGRRFRVRRELLEDLESQSVAEHLAKLRKALLILHSPRDQVVGIDHARRIYEAARHPKSFVSLDDADHLLSRREDAAYVADLIRAWSSRYVDLAAGDQERPTAEAGEVVVRESGTGRFANEIAAGLHALRADEPASVGGDDSGPTPYGLLLAALGACTSMTLRMYAERKELPLERVSVRLRHEKIHAEDCADCETKKGRVDQIDREITIEGDLSEEQRQRLLEIADRCPVHRTLTSEVRIRTRPE